MNSVVSGARWFADDAVGLALRVAVAVTRGCAARRAGQQGVDRPMFALVFDCDTDEDLAVVTAVHDRLTSYGIVPSYAVPGELLRAGAEQYRAIAASGAEMLNHGSARHCRFDAATRTYESTFFYDRLSWAEVEADVRQGHLDHLTVLGRAPTGFRTPHFGTFGGHRDLERLWRLLAELGYRYSSSTMPIRGLVHGPVHPVLPGLVEIPVSGRPTHPHRVLDSWSFRYAPGRRADTATFERELGMLVDRLLRGEPALVNVYADPSQVHDWPGFFETVARAASVAVPALAAVAELAHA